MEYDKRVGIQLRNIHNVVRRLVDNQPSNKVMNKLTGTNTWLIAYIAEQTDKGRDVFQKDIEETFGITRSCVSKVITLMEQKGFIERKEVEYDARLKKLVLTEEAAKYGAKMHDDAMEMEKKIMAGFTEEESHKLIEFLERIMFNLEKELDKL
ncbi:MAG: MarR family transcriptional regulator [Lachnospiraceae bacterium]|nr:MarR family transcriptional regulator [Lachnospiraceae bacterium]